MFYLPVNFSLLCVYIFFICVISFISLLMCVCVCILPVYFHVYLPVYPSVHLPIYLSIYFTYFPILTSLCITCKFSSLPTCLSYPPIHLFTCILLFLPLLRLSIHPCIQPSVFLSIIHVTQLQNFSTQHSASLYHRRSSLFAFTLVRPQHSLGTSIRHLIPLEIKAEGSDLLFFLIFLLITFLLVIINIYRSL